MTEIPDISTLFRVDGLVAAVTGAGGGIGLLMARALEANGAKVFILDMNEAKLQEAVKEAKYGNLIPIPCDITSQASLKAAADAITEQIGYVNVFIANAGTPGIYPPRISADASLAEIVDKWWDTPLNAFASVYKVNNAGTFYSILAFLKLLDAGNKKGNVETSSLIIGTASITGFNRQVPSGFAYATSKAGVVHMMKQFATYLVSFNIRCNVLAPGLYPTDMSNPALEVDGDKLLATIPAGRTGTIEDMAGAILFLASRSGAYCNGMVFISDGGRLSTLPATY
ncbi:uncharacterized protein V1518DRAFT_422919 [Limtongia smithiae]|uniref:uncharacterized protein n=1 Tax=Limtongia smithiae TaxID=1125753 RepID=UPI0034CE1C6C